MVGRGSVLLRVAAILLTAVGSLAYSQVSTNTLPSASTNVQNNGVSTSTSNQTGMLPYKCADTSASGTAQSCSTTPPVTLAPGNCFIYTTTTSNSSTGLTVAVNGGSALNVAIAGTSGWTTTLSTSPHSITAGKPLLACYDGTNLNMAATGISSSGASSALVALGRYTVSGANSLSMFTRNASGQSGNLFQSDFDLYEIDIIDSTFALSLTPGFQYSTDATTCDASSTYDYHVGNFFDGTNNSSGNTTSSMNLTDGNDPLATNTGFNATLELYNPLGTGRVKQMGGKVIMIHSTAGLVTREVIGSYHTNTSAVLGLCLVTSGANFATVTVEVYGKAH